MNSIENKQSYKGAGNIASNVSNRITGRARLPFAMLFDSREFYNFALADNINLFTHKKLPDFINNFVEIPLTSNDEIKTSITYLTTDIVPGRAPEQVLVKAFGNDRQKDNVINNDTDSLAVTFRNFFPEPKELSDYTGILSNDYLPDDVPDKVKQLREFIYKSGILNKKDINYILNQNLLGHVKTQDRLDMIVASSVEASYEGSVTLMSNDTDTDSVSDKIIFWERGEDKDPLTFVECMVYLLTYIEFYIVFPENKKWKYLLKGASGEEVLTIPQWRKIQSDKVDRFDRRFELFNKFYNIFQKKIKIIRDDNDKQAEIQALSIDDFGLKIRNIYADVTREIYESYITNLNNYSPPEQKITPRDEDLVPLPEIIEENITCDTTGNYKREFEDVKDQVKGNKIWWLASEDETSTKTVIGKPSDYLICINPDGTFKYRGIAYKDYIHNQGADKESSLKLSHIITSNGEIFGFNNFLRNKQYCTSEYLSKRNEEIEVKEGTECSQEQPLCCVTHGMLAKLLMSHNLISKDNGMISVGEIHLDKNFKITGVNTQSGTFEPNSFSNDNAKLVISSHVKEDIPNFYLGDFDHDNNIENSLSPILKQSSSSSTDTDSEEDESKNSTPMSIEMQEIKRDTPDPTIDADQQEPIQDPNTNPEQLRDSNEFENFMDDAANIRRDSNGDIIFEDQVQQTGEETGEEQTDGNTGSTREDQSGSQKRPDGSSNTQPIGSGTSKTPEGNQDSGSKRSHGNSPGDDKRDQFLRDNDLQLGKIKGDGDCLFVALLHVLGNDAPSAESVAELRESIVNYITSDISSKIDRRVVFDTQNESGENVRIEDTQKLTFWQVYGETILAQPSTNNQSSVKMYADIDDYINTMKSTTSDPRKPRGRFGTVFEIMAFRELHSSDLNRLYGSDKIQIVKLDTNNNLVLEIPPSDRSEEIANVDLHSPILLYKDQTAHYDIAKPLPIGNSSASKKSHDDEERPIESDEPYPDTNKGVIAYVNAIFKFSLEEDQEANELRVLLASMNE